MPDEQQRATSFTDCLRLALNPVGNNKSFRNRGGLLAYISSVAFGICSLEGTRFSGYGRIEQLVISQLTLLAIELSVPGYYLWSPVHSGP
jgi:hypothetical protein